MREHATSIFAEMSDLARRTGSINLGQGFPDTDGPAEVAEVARACIAESWEPIPSAPGVPDLHGNCRALGTLLQVVSGL